MSDDDENATPDDDENAAPDDAEGNADGNGERPPPPQEEPVYNDRSKLDFDPDDGLFTGTAVDGGTDIPGPHENVDDVDPDDSDDESDDSDDSDDSKDSDGDDGEGSA